MNKVHFSSKTDDWETPTQVFEYLNRRYQFTLDVCASDTNFKCENYFTKEQDGLSQDWGKEICWMNPPYGRVITNWMEKAYNSYLNGATVVCLVPSRTDTKWWHNFAMKGNIELVKGRLKFGGYHSSAPFPSALVYFDNETRNSVLPKLVRRLHI